MNVTHWFGFACPLPEPNYPVYRCTCGRYYKRAFVIDRNNIYQAFYRDVWIRDRKEKK